MKTSNLLLLSLLAFLFLSTIGVDLSMKSDLDSIDFSDPFRGYSSQALKPFKYVEIKGQPFGVVEIWPGEKFEMRKQETDALGQSLYVDWKMRGDTLSFMLMMKEGDRPIPSEIGDYDTGKPHVYLIAPTIPAISSEGIVTRVSHWPGGNFSAVQKGKGILLNDNKFDNLIITVSRGAMVAIDGENKLGTAEVIVRDSSKLAVKKDVFKSFKMQADDAAHVNLPASLLRKSRDL